MRSDERRLLLSDRDLRQQARIGHREAVEIAVPSDGQRPSDESLLVDDLRVAQLLLGPHDVIDRVELVLQLDLLAAQVLDLGAADSHLLGQALHLVAHPDETLAQLLHLGLLLRQLPVHVGDHLLQTVDTQIGLAQLGRRTLQRLDLRAVLPQQPVDGLDVVVDLLDGTAASLRLPSHGDQVLARLDQREVLRDGVDVREHGIDQRVLRADDQLQRIAPALGLDGNLPAHAGGKECNDAQRRGGCYMLHLVFHGSDSLRVYGLVCLQAQIYA